MNTPKLITMQMIWDKLERNERLLQSILEKEAANNVTEYSISKAAKLLHLGCDTVLDLIKTKKLQARRVRNSKAKSGYSYRITHRAIYNFQRRAVNFYEPDDIEESEYHAGPSPAEELAREIFGRNK